MNDVELIIIIIIMNIIEGQIYFCAVELHHSLQDDHTLHKEVLVLYGSLSVTLPCTIPWCTEEDHVCNLKEKQTIDIIIIEENGKQDKEHYRM